MQAIRKVSSVVLIVLGDVVSLYVALLLAVLTRAYLLPKALGNLYEFYPVEYFFRSTWMAGVFILVYMYEGLYTRRTNFYFETEKILKANVLSILAVVGLLFTLKIAAEFSRPTVFLFWLAANVAVPVGKYYTKVILFRAGLRRTRALVVGAKALGSELVKGLKRESYLGYEVVGFVDDSGDADANIDGVRDLGGLERIEKLVKRARIETVFVTLHDRPMNEFSEIAGKIQPFTRNVILVPDMAGCAVLHSDISPLLQEELILLRMRNPLQSSFPRAVKRSFDLLVTLSVLPVLLPLIGLLALLVKLTSSGPVFFLQTRVGRNGKSFPCVKFRTMVVDAEKRLQEILDSDPSAREEWEKYKKLKKDPRVSRIGRFLRQTSLDEIPQIFNILLGDMSLVGPRPCLPDEIDIYYREDAQFYTSVTPGVTGLWQISGRNKLDFRSRVYLESIYARNWSLWLDVVILFQTVRVVFGRGGAY